MLPPAFWSGSRITAATGSGSSNRIFSSIAFAAHSGSRCAGQLDRGLDRLRAAGGEEHPVQVTGSEGGEPGRELDRARMRVAPDRDEVQLPHLGRGRVPQLRATVTGVDAEQR